MDIRSQVSMVFHLDKCIGCHTCSVACKNIWTDRKGTEYMWWNNVETKPGTGYPTKWEDQKIYKGGWQLSLKQNWLSGSKTIGEKTLELKSSSKFSTVFNIFHNPNMPTMDDYYEPFTYDYGNLFSAKESDDQPTARPLSMVTGKPMDIKAGPNWDDDLSGSNVYAANDPNLEDLSAEEKQQIFEIEKLVMFYFPRICNHCSNPSCVAACPSGALYKRGEDGIVLVNQEKCRGWRMCVSACPYKKTYYNWSTGKAEKCVLCYPRLESGQAPACFHSCVGRIRYLGIILYDQDQLLEIAKLPDDQLVEAQRKMILNPHDPAVIEAAKQAGIHDSVITAAQNSPVYKFVKEWGIAFPPHVEYRTFPMLFYVPPLLPILGTKNNELYDTTDRNYFSALDKARLPMKYLAQMFSAGNESILKGAFKKLMAVRTHRRSITVKDVSQNMAGEVLQEAQMTAEMAEAIYKLTSLPTFEERFVIPPMHREEALEALKDPLDAKGADGFGFMHEPHRGW